jgi:predicted glycosyl hydrolase (DUF1957 family)
MLWANFLHIYQPPTQTPEILERVADECYRKLVAIWQRHPDARVTLNISACLTEQLDRAGLGDVIAGIRELAERGQIELTGSAKYHPILPLIPEEEARRQIELNTETNRAYFGDAYRPRGFFPPEMAISRPVLETIRDMGFEWVILDEIARDGTIGRDASIARSLDDACYELSGCPGFHVFFRERTHSDAIATRRIASGAQFQRAVEPLLDQHGYLLTGTDGEFYGHHIKGQEAVLSVAYKAAAPPTCTISDLLERFPERRPADPQPSSWTTWPDELERGIPFPQWHYPKHKLHTLQWRLTNAVIQLVRSSERRDGYAEARALLDEGLHSCQYWWASCRFAWSTDMIERGARKLVAAAEALDGLRTHKRVLDVQRIHRDLHTAVWQWQHAGKPAKIRRAYKAAHAGAGLDEAADEDEAPSPDDPADAAEPRA